jgi:carbamoyl-phosphate synthase small subunit
VGNYGVNPDDAESDRVQVAAFVVREASRRASSWRATSTLQAYLEEARVPGIEGIDTRRLTLRLRQAGAMRAGLSTTDVDPRGLLERVRAQPPMEGWDLTGEVTSAVAFAASDVVGPAGAADGRVFRVAAYDFGIKRNILRLLAENGCETTVFPARTDPADVLAGGFDGVFLSNGPGDPAATVFGIEAVAGLMGRIPMFGICLGHQLLALALGGRTYKLAFGHRGVNQPVKDLDTGRVEISSHTHGFAVAPRGWDVHSVTHREHGELGGRGGGRPSLRQTAHGRVALTHWNLNDGTLEGLRCLDTPAFSVQYHPEAAPGPHDARHLFGRFRALMEAA